MSLKVIIRAPNHLGDCVMALPMINEAREAHPGAHITVLAPESLAELYQHNAEVDTTLPIPTKYVHGMMAVVKIKELLAPQAFDLGYILPPSFGAAAGFKLAGIKERIGYVADGRRLLLTRPMALPTPLNCQHRSVTYFDLLRRSVGRNLEYAPPRLYLHDNDLENGASRLAAFGLPAGDRYVTIAFRAVAVARRWGVANYAELAKLLAAKYGVSIVLIGAADDAREGDELAAAVGEHRVVNLAGRCTVRESAAVIARSQLFVGDDSGPAHLAAATGVPVVVSFGAGDPGETAPVGDLVRVVRRTDLDCIACVRNTCPLKGADNLKCMTGLSVAAVFTEISKFEKQAFGVGGR